MARKKKPSGRNKHRVWIPDDGFGGLKYTNGHGMMRIDGWPDGTFEYRYVFCFNEWGVDGDGYRFFWDGVVGDVWVPKDGLWQQLDKIGPNPYERLDGSDIRESFGKAKMDGPDYVREWIEVEPTHRWAVPTDIV